MGKSITKVLILFCLILAGITIAKAEITNTLPSSVITYPHVNAYYQEGSDIVIRVYATDIGGTFTDGTVENVEFFIDGVKEHETNVHEDHNYIYVWENVQEGEYRITARATDNDGDSFTSAGVLITVGTDLAYRKGMSAGKGKYLGNLISPSSVRADFLTFWNSGTAENAHKWGSIEGTRDVMNWTNGDNIYNYAASNHLAFRYHAIAWGSQYPTWLESLDTEDFQAEIEEYMVEMAARYPYLDQIDVLNENLYLNTWNGEEHAAGTPYFREGLGGPGETGYDWVIWLFEKAREYFPNSKLVMNDFELENNPNGIQEMLDVIKVLRDRGLIDGFGTQAHTFNVDGFWDDQDLLRERINMMASSGIPVYVTELDLKGSPASETNQLRAYENIFPVFWEHPAVAGVTLWGYVEEDMWQEDAGLIHADGTKKPALIWLEEYMESLPDLGYPFYGEKMDVTNNLIANGEFNQGTIGWTVQNNEGATSSMEVVQDAGMSGSNALRICPDNEGSANWHIQLKQIIPIGNGRTYSISFMAKADDERTINVAVQQDEGSYNTYFDEVVALTSEVQTFNVEFVSTADDNAAALKFYLGNNPTCVYIDDVKAFDITDYEDPVDEDPDDEDPADEDPADEDPADEDPADEDPADEDPADEDPVDEDPVDEDPVDEDPADEDPVDEDPIDEDPIDEDPVQEDPIDEDPIDENPVDADPIDEDPVDADPVDADPTNENPADEDPTDEDPVNSVNFIDAERNIKVFPNPFQDQIVVTIKGLTNSANYSIISINGQLVKQGVLSNDMAIPTGDLNKGIYILRVQSSDFIEIIRITKQ